MMRRRHLLTLAAVALAVIPIESFAQGTLSTQGFGFPTGQMSARARGTGGGLSEFDPETPLNPASIATASDPRMYLQYEPELRRLSNGSTTSNSVTPRFAVATLSVPIAGRGSVGVSVSSFLDRTSSTSLTSDQVIGGEAIPVTETTRILGAINDVRVAFGYSLSPKVQVGVGGHVFVGQNRTFFTQAFPDTLKFSSITQVTTLGFTGFAASAGILARPSRTFGLALSARKGAGIDAKSGDSVVANADIPDRFAAAVSYEGIPGTSISVHGARDLWSNLNGLGSTAATAVDTWEGGVGVEALGPRIAARQTIFRVGARYRTLPFLAAGSEVNELSFGGGVGAQFFRNRATFDMSFERAARTPDLSSVDARERAYIFSFGLRVRP